MSTIVFNPIGPPFDFSVSGGATGFVETLTGNDGIAATPSGGNINVIGNGVVASGISTAGNIYVTDSGSTQTINVTQAQEITNYTPISIANSPYTVVPTDYYISVDTSGGAITIKLPNSPTIYRAFVIKDRTGNSMTNNISITTVGGSVLIDGVTTYTVNENYEGVDILWNGTSYEVW